MNIANTCYYLNLITHFFQLFSVLSVTPKYCYSCSQGFLSNIMVHNKWTLTERMTITHNSFR